MNETLKEVCLISSNMYSKGWDERNGGNISVMVDEREALKNLTPIAKPETIELGFDASTLFGRVFIVSGTGKYFKNIEADPESNLGIIRINKNGTTADILWGYKGGGRPTSELPTHLMSHIVRLGADPNHRVIIHSHPTNILSMTFVHSLDEREFTKTLWRMITECMVVFPDGIAVLPWMLCGTTEIGIKTAEKMKEFRLCVWANHGIFGTGTTIDEAFGLVETVEKAAEIYLKTRSSEILNTISDEQLRIIAKAFKVTPRKGWL